jgi:hypothetical protein
MKRKQSIPVLYKKAKTDRPESSFFACRRRRCRFEREVGE